jgi:hypothetical protein
MIIPVEERFLEYTGRRDGAGRGGGTTGSGAGGGAGTGSGAGDSTIFTSGAAGASTAKIVWHFGHFTFFPT